MIDEFASYLGVGSEVAVITRNAMNGKMSYRESLMLRLSIMKPTKMQFLEFLGAYDIKLTPGISELVEELHRLNVHVYLVGYYGTFEKDVSTDCDT